MDKDVLAVLKEMVSELRGIKEEVKQVDKTLVQLERILMDNWRSK